MLLAFISFLVFSPLSVRLYLTSYLFRYYDKLSLEHLQVYYAVNNALDRPGQFPDKNLLEPLSNMGLREGGNKIYFFRVQVPYKF